MSGKVRLGDVERGKRVRGVSFTGRRHWRRLSGKDNVFAYTESYGRRVEVLRFRKMFVARYRTKRGQQLGEVLPDRRGRPRCFGTVESCMEEVDRVLRQVKPPRQFNTDPTLKLSLGTLADLIYAHVDYNHRRFFAIVSEIASDADREALKLLEIAEMWGPRARSGTTARREIKKIISGWRPRRSYKPVMLCVLLERKETTFDHLVDRTREVLGWAPPTKTLRIALANDAKLEKPCITEVRKGVYSLTSKGREEALRSSRRLAWPKEGA